jgi:flagellar basal-body rod protein FlgB
MIQKSDSVTVSLMRLALDAASLNQQAIANNIANAHSPGYVPMRVRFDAQMANVRSSVRRGEEVKPAQLKGIQPTLERMVDADTRTGVAGLDMETARLSENAVHYQALLKALDKHLSIIGSAIHEGKA